MVQHENSRLEKKEFQSSDKMNGFTELIERNPLVWLIVQSCILNLTQIP